MNLKDITITAKTALDIANELKNIELKSAILELKEELLNIREENLVLKEQLKIQNSYNFIFDKNGWYWNLTENGSKDEAYCPSCKDGHNKIVRMKDNNDCYACTVCNYFAYKH